MPRESVARRVGEREPHAGFVVRVLLASTTIRSGVPAPEEAAETHSAR